MLFSEVRATEQQWTQAACVSICMLLSYANPLLHWGVESMLEYVGRQCACIVAVIQWEQLLHTELSIQISDYQCTIHGAGAIYEW